MGTALLIWVSAFAAIIGAWRGVDLLQERTSRPIRQHQRPVLSLTQPQPRDSQLVHHAQLLIHELVSDAQLLPENDRYAQEWLAAWRKRSTDPELLNGAYEVLNRAVIEDDLLRQFSPDRRERVDAWLVECNKERRGS